MIFKTANYSNTNHNFVFLNVNINNQKPYYFPAICVLKNILQRGKPTRMSKFLQSKLSEIHKTDVFQDFTPLISNEKPIWNQIIRGDVLNDYFPAKVFFDELIPKYFSEYPFLNQLIVPEVPINYITQAEVAQFKEQQVDFYLPQAFLVIEIDGFGHDEVADNIRDKHLKKYLIETFRFSTVEVKTENQSFLNKIEKIKERLVKVSNRIDKLNINNRENEILNSNKNEHVPSLNDYLKAYSDNVFNSKKDILIATAILRFQLLCLDLLQNSVLKIKEDNNIWCFQIKTDTKFDFIEYALDDLKLWLNNIFQLQKVKHGEISWSIEIVENFTNNNAVKIDFSLFKRYTDEYSDQLDVVFVRNHYFDMHYSFDNKNINEIKFLGFEPYDFYQISASKPFNYSFIFDDSEKCDKNALSFFLDNIFGYPNFRDGQLNIIANTLRGNSTIGLLPTGGGKSICFQLPIFLQPGISFVVCPIKSLMFDQKIDLNQIQISRVEHLTSNDKGTDKEKILNKFKNGQYQFIFISPERFQQSIFRDYLSSIQKTYSFTYAVIDEVHCLSEWGHDFRVSYLNLSKTINRYCSENTKFIALTATASIKVLEDIKLELRIKNENVITLTNYSRPELEFKVLSDNKNKYRSLVSLLEELDDQMNFSNPKGEESNAGIIFTNSVNGSSGCFNLSNLLTTNLGVKVDYFSGSKPNDCTIDFDEYKNEVQSKFKNNELPLILATKAFGMGVNKKNVSFTIHYGIPGSMESLYQEAGRAGRDKERYIDSKAKCYVLFGEHSGEQKETEVLWDQNSSIADLKKNKDAIKGDLSSNLFLLTSGLDDISLEFRIIRELFNRFIRDNSTKHIVIKSSDLIFLFKNNQDEDQLISVGKTRAQKSIYRLVQLGVIKDWTVDDYIRGVYTIELNEFDLDSIKNSLKTNIEKYDSNSVFDEIITQDFKNNYKNLFEFELVEIDFVILRLLHWVYDHFIYNRRQSLKNVYEVCYSYIKSTLNEELKQNNLKESLESYFKFNESSFVLQHISENAYDFDRWFEVFYKLDKNKNRVKEVISSVELNGLQANLSRFLESYANNIGLNTISGLVRLLNNDFENLDGRHRLQTSFEFILFSSKFSKEDTIYILKNSCIIVRNFKMIFRNNFAEFLINTFELDEEAHFLINDTLEDEFSTEFLMKNANKKLINLNNKLNEQFEKII